jgi:hypothetical protein
VSLPTAPPPRLLRAIGRWTLVALVINSIIGSGIFGLLSEVGRLLGTAAPFAYLLAAAGIETDRRLLRRGVLTVRSLGRPVSLRARDVRAVRRRADGVVRVARPAHVGGSQCEPVHRVSGTFWGFANQPLPRAGLVTVRLAFLTAVNCRASRRRV